MLAIQGDFAAHKRALARVGVCAVEVRRRADFERIDGLIIPGGESTTMLKFLLEEDLGNAIETFARSGRPVFGTCAGAILLAREVKNPGQPSLALIDIAVERNAYGRQVDSFIGAAEASMEGGPLEAVFIRAPKIIGVGPNVNTIATLGGGPVLVREGNILAATFHPELTPDPRTHNLFIEMAGGL
ncbi:MAG TPA: pyridoxal 5'-phosphate synthase glutaminase subunit PdxT [Blastocatellia bacterium]|nr:pyridoxal 5'-phosphate synthase glutaminase subunit PdxT [Blastocatellia bacterium]